MHAHLIPNIDDGSRSNEESEKLIKGLIALGFKKLISTPHIMQDYYPNTPETIRKGLEGLELEIHEFTTETGLKIAAEYYGDEYFVELLKSDQEILTIGTKYVLFEVSMLAESPLLQTIIFNLRAKGFTPILAHPERYLYYKNKLEMYENIDCELQVNLLSLAGYYGPMQKKLGLKLIEEFNVGFLGTDIHHENQLRYLEKLTKDKKTMRILMKKEWKNAIL